MGKKKTSIRRGLKTEKTKKGEDSISIKIPPELRNNPDFLMDPLKFLKADALDGDGKKIDMPIDAFIRSTKILDSSGKEIIYKK